MTDAFTSSFILTWSSCRSVPSGCAQVCGQDDRPQQARRPPRPPPGPGLDVRQGPRGCPLRAGPRAVSRPSRWRLPCVRNCSLRTLFEPDSRRVRAMSDVPYCAVSASDTLTARVATAVCCALSTVRVTTLRWLSSSWCKTEGTDLEKERDKVL